MDVDEIGTHKMSINVLGHLSILIHFIEVLRDFELRARRRRRFFVLLQGGGGSGGGGGGDQFHAQ
jgi:hypothetical protein